MELRFSQARSTKDLDLTVRASENSAAALRERLQTADAAQLSNFFMFVVDERGYAPQCGHSNASSSIEGG